MKNLYYNPKTRDLVWYDCETAEVTIMEALPHVRVVGKNLDTGELVGDLRDAQKKVGGRKCGACGEVGHSRRTCHAKE